MVDLIGPVVFSTVVKSYKYRQRDERPFDTCFAEQHYENYIGTSCNPAGLDSPSDKCLNTFVASGDIYIIMNRDYGATKDYYEMNIRLKDMQWQSRLWETTLSEPEPENYYRSVLL